MSSSPPRPARIPWLQLSLRIVAVLVAITAIIIAIIVVATRHKIWYTVFASALISLFIDAAEIIALASRYIHKFRDPIPRINPVVLIALDFCALCFLIWSFFALFLDTWGMRVPKTYTATTLVVVETWFAVAIGAIHAVLIVFDCVDCCSVRQSNRPEYEYQQRVRPRARPRPRPRARSRSRDDLFDMDW